VKGGPRGDGAGLLFDLDGTLERSGVDIVSSDLTGPAVYAYLHQRLGLPAS
jgi:hypothetical protein